jgi:hypothetical protein
MPTWKFLSPLATVLLFTLLPRPVWSEEKPTPRALKVFHYERPSGYFTGAWKIEKGWDAEAEKEYADFVTKIGEARERRGFTFGQAIRSKKINPLWTEEDKNYRVQADCATFPYLVRAYFAYKTGRPYVWQSNKERRYGKENRVRTLSDWSQYENPEKFFPAFDATLSSAHYRMASHLEGTDTYPIDVTAESLTPGTVYYDPNGHLLLVYKVDDYSGDILMLDSHPDGTMTIRKFGNRYTIGSAKYGGGFKRWRHDVVELTDPETGAFKVRRKTNAESDFYSATAQYQWEFDIDGHKLDYWEWIRARVSRNGIYCYPIEDFNLLLDTVCEEIQYRVSAVNGALDAGLSAKKHPNKLPYNIYGASGEWEEYSSPGRDVRIRAAFREAFAYVLKTMELAAKGSSRLKYRVEPWELFKEYQRIWDEHADNTLCKFIYKRSDGTEVELNLNDVQDRLFDISFDPYHCAELRWGARPDSKHEKARGEFATCPEAPRKLFWYKEEQRLRNRTSRLVGKGTATHRGPVEPPDLDVPALLKCYAEKVPEWEKCHTRERIKASGMDKEE